MYKLNIGDPKTGKTYKKELSEDESKNLRRLKIGDKVKGDSFGFSGYEFQITGGSDAAGFPMRFDVNREGRAKVLIAEGVGTRHKRKGTRLRRTVAGAIIGPKIVQINMKVTKHGKSLLGEEESQPEESQPEEATPAQGGDEKSQAPKEEQKEEASKSEEKAEEPKKEDEKVEKDAQKVEMEKKEEEKRKKQNL